MPGNSCLKLLRAPLKPHLKQTALRGRSAERQQKKLKVCKHLERGHLPFSPLFAPGGFERPIPVLLPVQQRKVVALKST